MKFTTALIALAALAVAAPDGGPPQKEHNRPAPPPPQQCRPGTYACTANAQGWQVCNTSGQFVFAGTCPPNTVCKFFQPSLSPYCVPPGFQIP